MRHVILCLALALLFLLPLTGLSAEGNTPPPITPATGAFDPEPFAPVFCDGDLLSIEVFDAYYDGRTLSMQWQVRNTSREPLYLLLDKQTVNGIPLEPAGEYNPNRAWLIPGASPFGDIEAALATPDTGATGWVDLGYTLLRPFKPGHESPYVVDGVAAPIVLEEVTLLPDGTLALPEGVQLDASLPYAEALVQAGVMERAGGMEIGLRLDRSPLPRTALPDGKPLDFSLPGYGIRVTRADFTTYAGHIDFELVFADREAMERFAAYYPTDTFSEKYWDYDFLDENGSRDWHSLSRFSNQERPEAQPDGTWVWRKIYTFSDIHALPKEIKAVPTRQQESIFAGRQSFPEEAFTLAFQEAAE